MSITRRSAAQQLRSAAGSNATGHEQPKSLNKSLVCCCCQSAGLPGSPGVKRRGLRARPCAGRSPRRRQRPSRSESLCTARHQLRRARRGTRPRRGTRSPGCSTFGGGAARRRQPDAGSCGVRPGGCGRTAVPLRRGGEKVGRSAVGGCQEGEGRAVGASSGCGRRGLRRGAPTLLFLGLGFCRRLGRPPGRGRCGAVRRQRARMRAPAQVSVTIVQSGGAGRGRVWGPGQCTMHCR